MAIFDGAECVKHACQCAKHIIALKNEQEQSLPIGIGLHYGQVLIGNIGSEEHLDYSALGETVNLASRICNYADAMQVMVTQSVVDQIADGEIKHSQPEYVTLRGYDKEIPLYRLIFD